MTREEILVFLERKWSRPRTYETATDEPGLGWVLDELIELGVLEVVNE